VRQEAAAGTGKGRPDQPYRMRLPGFLLDEDEVGLGDVIKRATSLAGIKPCAGCARRAETLNRALSFTTVRRARR
jgi:hypothetical protein